MSFPDNKATVRIASLVVQSLPVHICVISTPKAVRQKQSAAMEVGQRAGSTQTDSTWPKAPWPETGRNGVNMGNLFERQFNVRAQKALKTVQVKLPGKLSRMLSEPGR